MDDQSNPRAIIGANNPPEPTPYESALAEIDGLFMEASNWCDGEPITSQMQADAISKLVADLRAASKRADDARAAEKKPFDDAGKEVQARYKPLIDKAAMAMDTAKKALVPFLQKIEAEKRRIAEEARREAEEKTRAAQEAARLASRSANLADQQDARFSEDQAKLAAEFAKDAAKDKAGAKGGARMMTLRTVKSAKIVDFTEFSRYVWAHRRADLEVWLSGYANTLLRAHVENMPGVEITSEQVAQ